MVANPPVPLAPAPPPVYAPQPSAGMAPAPNGPLKTHPMAIASLACALLPLVAFASPRVGVFIAGLGALLGIVFGFLALAQIKAEPQRWTGRGLAIAGITIGFAVLALAVLFIFIAFLFVAALAAACASCGGGSKLVPAFLVATGIRTADVRKRADALRRLTSHHPSCSHFAADFVRVGTWTLCRGCVVAGTSLTITWLAISTLGASWSWQVLLAAGSCVGSLQFISTAGRARSAFTKTLVKAALGAGIAAVSIGILRAPLALELQLAVLAAGAIVAMATLVPRGRALAKHACT